MVREGVKCEEWQGKVLNVRSGKVMCLASYKGSDLTADTTARATKCWRMDRWWESLEPGGTLRGRENIMQPLGEIHKFPLRPRGDGKAARIRTNQPSTRRTLKFTKMIILSSAQFSVFDTLLYKNRPFNNTEI